MYRYMAMLGSLEKCLWLSAHWKMSAISIEYRTGCPFSPCSTYLFSYCPFPHTFSFFTVILSASVSSSYRWCGKRIFLSERHLVRRNIHLTIAAALVAYSERISSGLHKVEGSWYRNQHRSKGYRRDFKKLTIRLQWTDKKYSTLWLSRIYYPIFTYWIYLKLSLFYN